MKSWKNTIKAGGSETISKPTPHPLEKKTLKNRYRVKMHVHGPIFQAHWKKTRPITFIGRVEKNAEKGSEKWKNIFFDLNKQCVRHFSAFF